jgi:hypothetical protein
MTDIATLTEADILAIPEDEPERLFSTPDELAPRYRALALRWHPDRGAGQAAENVFRRVTLLHARAKQRLDAGIWRAPGLLELRGTDGITRRIRHLRDYDIGIGRAYLGRAHLTAVIDAEFSDLAETAAARIEAPKFRDARMAREMSPRLPTPGAREIPLPGGIALVLEMPAGKIRLRDLLAHVGGRLDPKHVGWITSELLNFVCYLEWAGLAHGDLSLDSVFVSPADHAIAVLGGWWFSARIGEKLTALPARTLAVAPRAVLDDKRASTRTDLELIRLLGRELLGDATGAAFRADPKIPRALGEWLRLPAPENPRRDYAAWPAVLEDSFGPRRFTKLSVTASDIFSPTGA